MDELKIEEKELFIEYLEKRFKENYDNEDEHLLFLKECENFLQSIITRSYEEGIKKGMKINNENFVDELFAVIKKFRDDSVINNIKNLLDENTVLSISED